MGFQHGKRKTREVRGAEKDYIEISHKVPSYKKQVKMKKKERGNGQGGLCQTCCGALEVRDLKPKTSANSGDGDHLP